MTGPDPAAAPSPQPAAPSPGEAPPRRPVRPPPGPVARALAWVLLIVPLAGTAFHGVFYLATDPEVRAAYARGMAIRVVLIVAFVNLAASILLYFRARMRLLIWARVASYLWILSLVPYIRILLYG